MMMMSNPRSRLRKKIDWIAITSCCLAATVYLNTLKAGFVYDDSRAILSNQDILPRSSWAVLWTNDFWGTPLIHSASHKSFRPLTTLSFRLNYYFSGFNPYSYHLTNVILHTLTTWLFVKVARLVFRPASLYQLSDSSSPAGCCCCSGNSSSTSGFGGSSSTCSSSPHGSRSSTRQSSPQPSSASTSSIFGFKWCWNWKGRRRNCAILLSSLLFACHPIHTEAVAGVVGRADVGSTAFALTAFLAYVNHVRCRDKYQKCNSSRQHHYHHYILADHLKTEHRCPYMNTGNISSSSTNRKFTSHAAVIVDQYSTTSSSQTGPIPQHPQQRHHNHHHNHHHYMLYLKSLTYLVMSIILATAAMLTKEQGITILLVCATFDLVRSVIRNRNYHQDKLSIWQIECCSSVTVLAISFVLLFHFRLSLMGGYSESPTFARADNPTSHHPSFFTRLATFLYLPVFNLLLLIFPYRLSYDWSMEAVPRIQKLADTRNLIMISFYFLLIRKIVKIARTLHKSNCGTNNNGTFEFLSKSGTLTMRHSPARHKGVCTVCWCTSNGNTVSHRKPNSSHNHNNNNSIICAPLIDDSCWNKSAGSAIWFNGVTHSSSSSSKSHYSRGTGGGGHLKPTFGYSNKLHQVRPSSAASSSSSSSSSYCTSSLTSNSLSAGSVLLQLAFLIWPFLPATNIFFYVGFVVAERVLYTPSVGFCLLVGHGFLRLWERIDHNSTTRTSTPIFNGPKAKQVLVTCALISLALLSARTILRNEEWQDEEKLYRAGIDVNPPKSWGNLGNVLSSQGHITEAEVAYRQALRFRSNMADVHYNLGLLLEGQGRFDEALTSYRSAIHFRPRLASAYVSLGQVLTRLGRTTEAMNIFQRCFQLSDDGIKDLRTHTEAKVSALLRFGNLLVEEDDDARSALKVYREAVNLMPPTYSQAQSVYNAMGEALYRTGDASEAEEWFKEALKTKPDHIPAHLTYGKMLARNKTRLLEAESWFRRAKKIAPGDSSVYHHYGQFLAIEGRHEEAAEAYVTAAELAPNDYDIIVGTANALRQIGDNIKAEVYYRKAVGLRPQESRAHMNLGAILHVNGKYSEAEDRYLMALRLNPVDDVTLLNLQKLRQLQSRRLQSHFSKSSAAGSSIANPSSSSSSSPSSSSSCSNTYKDTKNHQKSTASGRRTDDQNKVKVKS